MTDAAIDFAAVARISSRVDLREIRLTGISATCQADLMDAPRPLQPVYAHTCVPVKVDGGTLEVACSYNFKVRSSDVELAEASMTYHIVYKLLGDQPTEPSDVEHFARANGAYHSWPFVRETIYGLTAKMGFPPYTLPVLSFLRSKPKAAALPEAPQPEGASSSESH